MPDLPYGGKEIPLEVIIYRQSNDGRIVDRDHRLYRARVPQGWLVFSDSDGPPIYVPDPAGEWAPASGPKVLTEDKRASLWDED